MKPIDINKCIDKISSDLSVEKEKVVSVIFNYLYGDCKTKFDAILQADFEIHDHIIKLDNGKCYVLDSVIDMIQNYINQGKPIIDPFTREKLSKDEISRIEKEKQLIDKNFRFIDKKKRDLTNAPFIVRYLPTIGVYKMYIAKLDHVNEIINLRESERANPSHVYAYLGTLAANITEEETGSDMNSDLILLKIKQLWEEEKLVAFINDTSLNIEFLMYHRIDDYEDWTGVMRPITIQNVLQQLEFLS